ncbi:MAG: hypothetical protein HYR87_07375 [Thaumarchaeota archaeon]|nr:hypothetical protein [Nitrososphaerota archaeon]
MAYELSFNKAFVYDSRQKGITLPISLKLAGQTVSLEAKVDTGASCCIFERKYGEDLGVDIESGIEQRVETVMGIFTAYGHDITISVLDYEFDCTAYFAAQYTFTRNVLGRVGWLDRVKLAIIDYDCKLYLSAYE